jgi:ATP-binding cassette subfamily F protein uup
MDKVVDHLLVFHGDARIQDFPGNYTQYREWKQIEEKKELQERKQAVESKTTKTLPEQAQIKTEEKVKLTFKEKRELESLEKEIAQLEAEKNTINVTLSSGNLPTDELIRQSSRFSDIMKLIDEKTSRWIELSDKTI